MQLAENDLRPVLVWIHGGGFHFGDSTDRAYGPEYLIGEDIVIVTINYRLGPLGKIKIYFTKTDIIIAFTVAIPSLK